MRTTKRKKRTSRAALKYAGLTLAGIALYIAAHDYATAQRGYIAYGGEVLLLALPVLYYAISQTFKDYLKSAKATFTARAGELEPRQ